MGYDCDQCGAVYCPPRNCTHCGSHNCMVDTSANDARACRQMIRELESDIEQLTSDAQSNRGKVPSDFPKIVCLCGSTRCMDAFHECGWQLTLDGYIVLTVGVCKHAEDHGGEALGEDVAARLDELHFRKIDLADWVLVLNINGYIGESTRKEIEYAMAAGKQVTYLEPEHCEGGE